MAVGEDVYCTLVMTDAYLPGAAVLAHSLRDSGTQKKLACLVVQDSLRPSTMTELQSLYNYVIPIGRIGNPTPANLYLMNRPDLLYTFTKINLWRLIQFRKIVYIDADVVALRAPDELFQLEDDFAAAPDVGWPDAFNTGVMVLAPHLGHYHALNTLATAGDSFDGADQGLLNQYFEHKPWKRLSFTYNCTPSANYQYEPAYRYYKRDITLVHFIGSEKPWRQGRSVQGSSGAYQELLSRWWAVYDRHFKVSTYDYIATGIREHRPVQEQVQDLPKQERPAFYATGYPVESTQPAPSHPAPHHVHRYSAPLPEAHATSTDAPLSDQAERAEAIDQGHVAPAPTLEQRKFSAPHMEWDATRSAPPVQSKPEAAHFPTTTYEFNTDPAPFRPPAAYPEPPKDMWFEIPKEPSKKTEKPKPIFPWEERDVPPPTRSFVDDEPLPSSASQPEPELEPAGLDEFEVTADEPTEPVTPSSRIHDDIPWHDFAAKKNAWDEISGIENYVRALTSFQRNRGNVQVVQQNPGSSNDASVLSPVAELEPAELLDQLKKRRESLILTDFPTSIERPSLPVTPAPRRRSTFWGEERDEQGDLPAAEGVPEQADWDPSAQLEQLRRTSLIGPEDLKLPDKIPKRSMPEHAASLPTGVPAPVLPLEQKQAIPRRHVEQADEDPNLPISGCGSPHGLETPGPRESILAAAASDEAELHVAKAPRFGEVDFGGDGVTGLPSRLNASEPVLSPTQQLTGAS